MKFSGCIGYTCTQETAPSVWTETITERHYVGDVLKSMMRNQSTDTLNDNIEISNRISIVADTYAKKNLGRMRYVVWHNSKWKIMSIEENYPRLILTIGGVYGE